MSHVSMVQSVSDVECADHPLAETSPKRAIEALAQFKVEACYEYHGTVVASPFHPFVAAIDAAFCDHRPLILSPDMLWLLIAQGFARHVNNNAEALRARFVKHDGKATLAVRRDDFVKGSPENPWSEVFADFSEQIKRQIGEENHSNIVASFSTTGAVEKAANEIVLMDSLKNYFEYECHTLCGIPRVTLEGTAEDWNELHRRVELLGRTYDLGWWTNRIGPILGRIAHNAGGADDPLLWKDIYKLNDGSGGPYINGWVVDFFPYLQTAGFVHKESNQLVKDWREFSANWDQYRQVKIETRNRQLAMHDDNGITTEALPGSLCKTPFQWRYFDRLYAMEFVAGFIGFTQNSEDFAVRPKIGWAVREV